MGESDIEKKGSLTIFIVLTTSFSMLFGILWNIVFYTFFNFNVFDFLQINEVITHTIRDSVYFIVPTLILIYIFIHYGEPDNKSIKNIDNSNQKRYTFKPIFYILILIFGIPLPIILYYYQRISLPKMCIDFLAVAILLFTPSIKFLKKVELFFNITINKSAVFLFLFTILVTLSAIFFALMRVDSITSKHSTTGSYILIKNSDTKPCDTIKSNNKYYYIGKTDNYVFFYNAVKDNVDVFPEKDIKKYSLR